MPLECVTNVQKFYQGSNVFVTGGTGFLGKLTVEKILRSCPDVNKVYVLIRPKKGLSIEERIKLLLDAVVFDRLKSERPGSLGKIVFVPGDCSSPRLGLSDSDYHDLTQHVNIVLHLAATVRFDEKLKVAMNVNVKGAMEVINLCWQCLSLKAGVFVTTAYSNYSHLHVKEKFYDPPPVQSEDVFALMDRVSDQELEILSHKITGSWKIPYLFSKATIEHVIFTHAKGLPISVVRPSMVVSTMSEPLPGWVDNMYGPIAITVGTASGVLRLNNAPSDVILDLIPADLVTNCIVAVALATNTRKTDAISVYNVATSDMNPLRIKVMADSMLQLRLTIPLKRLLWHPFVLSVANFKLYTLLTLFLHVLPGYVVDLALRLKGQPPMLMKIYRKIRVYAVIMNLFPMKEPIFYCDNTIDLYEKLDSKDKELFFFDMRQISWPEFFQRAALESRKYLLGETLDDLEKARVHARKLCILHTVVKNIFFGLVILATLRMVTHFLANIF